MSSKIETKRKGELGRTECTFCGCANGDEGALQVIAEHVEFEQEQFLKDGGFPGVSLDAYSSLLTIEMAHRDAMERTRCDDCLDDFKQKKFYVLDGDGYQYNAYGLAGKSKALAS